MKLTRTVKKLFYKLVPSWLSSKILGTSKSLYVRLSRSLFFFILLVALIPSLFQALIANHECGRMVEQEYKNRLVWQMRHTQESVDEFLADHITALRFLFGSYSIDEFKEQEKLHQIFSKFKGQFPNLMFVDLGLVDSTGYQTTHTGPYKLQGENYANESWFYEVVVRGGYTSDVFLGRRKTPHILMAIKSPPFENGTFWILRSTINPEAFEKMVGAMNCLHEDDTFLINKDGLLQSSSRFNGEVLDPYFLQPPSPRQEIVFAENGNAQGQKEVIAYASLRNKDWLLVFVQPLSVKLRDLYALQRSMIGVLILCITGVFLLAIVITRNFVGRLKAAEQEHEALLHKVEHTNKLALIGRLAAGVAHEINNPLAIINEMAGLMKDKTEMANDFADKDRYLQLLQTIHSSVDRCRTITHRLLGFARQMDVSPEVIDVNDLITEVLGFLEKEAFHRSIRIDLDLTEPLPTIESDRGQLQQVLLNVINNAMHAVDNGGEIFITTWATEEKAVKVKIRDNGCGIPQDKIERIFEPFFTTKGREKGTGLGLSITYGIINKLGGKVSVESEVGKGTTFIIELPGYCG